MTDRQFESGQGDAANEAAKNQDNDTTISRGSDKWIAWRDNLTMEQQALADQGLLLPGAPSDEGFTIVEYYGQNGSIKHHPGLNIQLEGNTLVVPASEDFQKIHGDDSTGPKRRY